ncbi:MULTISPECIES: hypothetical protein [Lactiplantibacillus]|jgi:hypothetical protein|uniref:Uncharacterized protein n=1 Tax=Lactiplantibacillus brownii TaxID=3069269 RepID=A0ABU1ADH9_9LACO|nr:MULTISPECIES: hypothetical protein [Lactiplantibacillus]EYR71885.1 hypothetical protein O209_04240 [Lactiplantibacillus plantarum WHE 92]MCT0161505.1 hypothetical protein [Lactiplantibacillus pentosus]MDQ7939038.1 hypothetical protein [Lactiplantibacillus brownii]TEA90760.1 hypothetical protein DM37_15520 [Lactiplantibacillus plantarum]
MTEVNKEYMSKDEVIKSLSGTPISLDVENDGTRVGTIVDGEKFYNKMLLFDPDRFTHCKNDNEVTVAANKDLDVKDKLNAAEWGIEKEKS